MTAASTGTNPELHTLPIAARPRRTWGQVAHGVMLPAKDVRTVLAALAADSLVSTQEVPKTADRNPTRTFYLWCVYHELATS